MKLKVFIICYLYILDKWYISEFQLIIRIIDNRIIIVTLKEEEKFLRKIRNFMLVRHGISVTIQGIRKIILKFQKTGNYEDHKRVGRPNVSLWSKRIIRRRLSLTNIAG